MEKITADPPLGLRLKWQVSDPHLGVSKFCLSHERQGTPASPGTQQPHASSFCDKLPFPATSAKGVQKGLSGTVAIEPCISNEGRQPGVRAMDTVRNSGACG